MSVPYRNDETFQIEAFGTGMPCAAVRFSVYVQCKCGKLATLNGEREGPATAMCRNCGHTKEYPGETDQSIAIMAMRKLIEGEDNKKLEE